MRGLFCGYGVLGDLKAIGADVVSNGVGVHPLTALDGIARLRGDGGRGA